MQGGLPWPSGEHARLATGRSAVRILAWPNQFLGLENLVGEICMLVPKIFYLLQDGLDFEEHLSLEPRKVDFKAAWELQ